MQFHFANPEWVLLLLIPFVVWKFFRRSIPKGGAIPVLYHPMAEELSMHMGQATDKRYSWRWLWRWLLWSCLVLAIMRPQLVDQQTHVSEEGYDIMLAVDLSLSMQALDFSTEEKLVSRLDVVKDVMKRFILKREGDRLGLVLFGAHAFLQSPLTLDNLALSQMLEQADIGIAGDATAIGDAVALSVKKLRDRPEGSRILILVTDGENTGGTIPPLDAAKLAQDYGIRIYTIGVGSNGLVPFPDRGRIVRMLMVLDEVLLTKLADQTGGKYFPATNLQSLESVYREIDQLEKSEAENRVVSITTPLYRYPLALAMLGIVVIMFAPVIGRFYAIRS